MNNFLPDLINSCLFYNLTASEISELITPLLYTIEEFPKNKVLFSEEDIHKKAGIILDGIIYIQKHYPNGKIVILEKRIPGDLIGENLVFSTLTCCGGEKIITKTKSTVLFFDYTIFKNLLFSNETMMLNYITLLNSNTQHLKHRLGMLSLFSIQGKLASYLYHECNKNNTLRVKQDFSKSDLAKYLDVSRPSLIREFKKLEDLKLIRMQDPYIDVLDLDGLLAVVIEKC